MLNSVKSYRWVRRNLPVVFVDCGYPNKQSKKLLAIHLKKKKMEKGGKFLFQGLSASRGIIGFICDNLVCFQGVIVPPETVSWR